MAISYYLDTSVLGKRYVSEIGSILDDARSLHPRRVTLS